MESNGLYEVRKLFTETADRFKAAGEEMRKSVESSKALVEQIRQEATVVGSDLKAQLAGALQLLETRTAEFNEFRTKVEAENKHQTEIYEKRFAELDKNLRGDDKTWVPLGVSVEEKEQRQAIRGLGEFMLDVGFEKFAGKTRFGKYERSGQSIGTTTEGGVTIPIPILQTVQYIRPRYGLVRELFTTFQMTTAEQQIPINTAEPLVYYVGEKQIPTESSVLFVDPNPSLKAKTLACYDIMSLEFAHDVAPAIVDFIGERFLIAISGEEDKQGLVGSNNPTGWYGWMHSTHKGVADVVMSANSFGALIHEDLVDLTRGVDDDDAENGMFIMSRSVLGIVEKLKDTTGQPLFKPMAEGPRSTILGYPYRTHRKMPVAADSSNNKPMMLFGNPKNMWFGDLQQVEVEWSREAAFFQGALVLRMRERYAIECVLAGGLARLRTKT